MRRVSFLVTCALILAWGVSCTRETTFTLSHGNDRDIIVAEDLETMRNLIEVSMTRKYEDLPLMDLVSRQKVFLVRAGTKVEVKDAHLFGRNVRIHILEGEHMGREGWVHKSVLHEILPPG